MWFMLFPMVWSFSYTVFLLVVPFFGGEGAFWSCLCGVLFVIFGEGVLLVFFFFSHMDFL